MTLLFSFICIYLIIGVFVADHCFEKAKEAPQWEEFERMADPVGLKLTMLLAVFAWPIVLTMLTVLWYKDK